MKHSLASSLIFLLILVVGTSARAEEKKKFGKGKNYWNSVLLSWYNFNNHVSVNIDVNIMVGDNHETKNSGKERVHKNSFLKKFNLCGTVSV